MGTWGGEAVFGVCGGRVCGAGLFEGRGEDLWRRKHPLVHSSKGDTGGILCRIIEVFTTSPTRKGSKCFGATGF